MFIFNSLKGIFKEEKLNIVKAHLSSPSPPVSQSSQALPSSLSVTEVQRYIASLKKQHSFRNPFLSQAEVRLKFLLQRDALPALEGIIVVGPEKVAIIEGKRIKEGDKINGFWVQKITSKEVWLKKGKKTYRLRLE